MRTKGLVIFDAYGTLVTARRGYEDTFSTALSCLGIDSSADMLASLQAASRGLDHTAWSRSRDNYIQRTGAILEEIAEDGIIDPESIPYVIPALEQLHQAPIVALPEAQSCLATLMRAGYTIAVCSNWGWDLREDLTNTGLLQSIDFLVTSAQTGYRKPHASIYQATLAATNYTAEEAVFIGDGLETDVLGPQRAGIRSVLLQQQGAQPFSGEQVASLASVPSLLLG